MPLEPMDKDRIDPRLVPHLQDGEAVLWQGAPAPNTFLTPSVVMTGLGLLLLGPALWFHFIDMLLPSMAAIDGPARQVPAVASSLVGLGLLVQHWHRRGSLWVYAITDRRLLSIMGDRLIRQAVSEEIELVGLQVIGRVVYWDEMDRGDRRSRRFDLEPGPEGMLIGFHGLDDPEAMRTRILAWSKDPSRQAAAQER